MIALVRLFLDASRRLRIHKLYWFTAALRRKFRANTMECGDK